MARRKRSTQNFGGDWTAEKLERVRKYLVAYATIMNKYQFRYAYVDAFAGTGYRKLREEEDVSQPLFPEFADPDSQRFLDGSARIALRVKPRFSKYVFIEKDPERFTELQSLKTEFPYLADDIQLQCADANTFLRGFCDQRNWEGHRAVLFLDPFGMQVEWATVAAVARTQAIDLWYLFPLGVAVNRLLKKDGQIDEAIRERLDRMFGAADWRERFYGLRDEKDLFGEATGVAKTGSFDSIARYFVDRLKTVFAGVAENPLPLYNSCNNPLFLLCFASGNAKGSKTAIKIAQDILKK